jgi:hypothetical protein
MNSLKWLKSQLENNYGNPHQCEIEWKDLDELLKQAENLNDIKGKIFEVTEEHLKLLKHSHVMWRASEYGAPMIDPKRPYGNTSVESDIAEILGWDEEDSQRAEKLHRELEIVLQIVLVTQTFEPGLYNIRNEYTTDWIKL